MSDDPLSPKPAGAWVTSTVPNANRPFDGPAEAPPEVRMAGPPRSAHWGLAALLLGVPLFTAAPVQILLNRDLWTRGPAGMKVPIAFVACLLSFVLIAGLGVTGVVCGVRGWLLASADRQPIALPLAGAMLSGVSLLIWIGIYLDLIAFFFEHLR
jgi:hypothetical protein